ncbi:hypothetical protein DAPPUDRAFT_257636 [Daphnia pulex]|uniref:Uncharacterized protein n=1 Tax=Daphnia pulex TaxID=6669 RepID=E9HDY5_DAPPU|nr:hypothetical protein DAPPUDRAFT_257636 [Daphnia pulex]|eukprot:EFX70050.1 hypothetical protein DAPPUDRAFT_257636 [Daphnia pulex]
MLRFKLVSRPRLSRPVMLWTLVEFLHSVVLSKLIRSCDGDDEAAAARVFLRRSDAPINNASNSTPSISRLIVLYVNTNSMYDALAWYRRYCTLHITHTTIKSTL